MLFNTQGKVVVLPRDASENQLRSVIERKIPSYPTGDKMFQLGTRAVFKEK